MSLAAPQMVSLLLIGRIALDGAGTSHALDTAHPQLIALLFITFLHGILTVQVFLYYISFANDRLYLKAIVCGIYILETVQVAIVCDQLYTGFVDLFFAGNLALTGGEFLIPEQKGAPMVIDLAGTGNSGNARGDEFCGSGNPLDLVGLSWVGTLVLGSIVTWFAQCLYAYRIYTFGSLLDVVPVARSPLVIGIVIVLLSTMQCGAGIVLGVEVHKARCFSQLISRGVRTAGGIWNGGGVICDSIIAASMTYLLYKSSHTGMRQTQRLVQKLIRLTIGTGTLTVIIALISLISLDLPKGHATFYQTLISTVSTGVISKVYANSMLVLLNSRAELSYDYPGTRDGNWHEMEWYISSQECATLTQERTVQEEGRNERGATCVDLPLNSGSSKAPKCGFVGPSNGSHPPKVL